MFANNCIPFLIGTLSDLFSAYAFALNKEVQREERKDQQKTTAQQLVASIQHHSTVSCRHGQINHTDQSRWNREIVLTE